MKKIIKKIWNLITKNISTILFIMWIIWFILLVLLINYNMKIDTNNEEQITKKRINHCWNCGNGIYLSDEECNQCSWRICSYCGACRAYGDCNAFQERLAKKRAETHTFFYDYIILLKNSDEPLTLFDYIQLYMLFFPYLFFVIIIFSILIYLIQNNRENQKLQIEYEKKIQYEKELKQQIEKERIARNKNGIFKVGDILYDTNNNQFTITGFDNDKILIEEPEIEIINWKMSGKVEKRTKLISKPYTIEEIKKKFIIK